jgi:hypothetical protein
MGPGVYAVFLALCWMGAAIVGINLILLRHVSALGAVDAQIESLSAPMGDRVSMGCGFAIARLLLFLFVAPGAAAGIIVVSILNVLLDDLSDAAVLAFDAAVFFGLFAAINLPMAWSMVRGQSGLIVAWGNGGFSEAIDRMMRDETPGG